MEETIIKVSSLCKDYNLYDKNIDQLRELFSIRHKKYHKVHQALNNINFEVKKGEHIGIIGTNGSGKSTLLKILTGVVTPTEGEVVVNGRISALLELGAGFNPTYTGIQNIYLNGTIMGYTREEMDKKLEDIVSFADIGEFINQPVKNYSSGMFARLAFAVAINVEPDILIVDEALSVGDAFFQNKCYRKFDELKEKGTTILFVSHDIESIKQMCTRVLWIEQGVQKMFGDRNEVCQEYFNMRMKRQNEENEEAIQKIINNELQVERNTKINKYPKLEVKAGDITTGKAEVISCSIKNENDKMTGNLVPGNHYIVEVVCKFHTDVSKALIGFTVEDVKGINYLAGNTYAISRKLVRAKAGEVIKVTFAFTMPRLKKGRYVITAAIAEGNQENHVMLFWAHAAREVEVSWEGYELAVLTIPYKISVAIEENAIFY